MPDAIVDSDGMQHEPEFMQIGRRKRGFMSRPDLQENDRLSIEGDTLTNTEDMNDDFGTFDADDAGMDDFLRGHVEYLPLDDGLVAPANLPGEIDQYDPRHPDSLEDGFDLT